jgi:adenylosuccinate lyase
MDFTRYQSPFSWRYGSDELRAIWSEEHKRQLWRKLWVALAETQQVYGITTEAQVQDLKVHAGDINIPRALEIEADIHHDLMSEIKTFAEQCPIGGGIIHLGATSMDIVDNADALRVKESLTIIQYKLARLLLTLLGQVEKYAETPIIALTHIQPAEPSTLGYRLGIYAQDLLMDWDQLSQAAVTYKAKGFKGAVGTGAAYTDLIGKENFKDFETRLSTALEIEFFPLTTQTYPRKQDFQLTNTLAGIAASLHKFALDLRILQSPPFGELSEPFRDKQVGSSAMPFKRNPINAEKITSLTRLLAQTPRAAWDNAANSILERTLDDSANRRTTLPEAFLIADEILTVAQKIISGLKVNETAIKRNLETYAPFAATERILMAAVKKGGDRQMLHEHLRELSLEAWDTIQKGGANPLADNLVEDKTLQKYISPKEIKALTKIGAHTGIAADRARLVAGHTQEIQAWFDKQKAH